MNIILSEYQLEMVSLRTAFMQSYHSGNPYFAFLTTLPCIICSLINFNDHSLKENDPTSKYSKVSSSFAKLDQRLKSDEKRLLWISTYSNSSLHAIMDKSSCDFEAEKEGSNFVHSLEVLRELSDWEIKTEHSEVLSWIGNDPNSTDISCCSNFSMSDGEEL